MLYNAGKTKFTDNLKEKILLSGFLNLEMELAIDHGYLLTWIVM